MKTNIAHKLIIAVMAVGMMSQAWAKGSWIVYPTSAPATNVENGIQDCDVDSKGTLWYVIGKTGLFSS